MRGVSEDAGANCEDFVGTCRAKRDLGFDDLGVRVRLRALADGGSRVVHPYTVTKSEFGDRAKCIGEG